MRQGRGRRSDRIPGSIASDKAAAVMATGAISLAAEHYSPLGLLFGAVASAAFIVVIAVAVRDRGFVPPAAEPDHALRAFSFVAAGALLATRWHSAAPAVGWVLAIAAGAVWLVLARRTISALAARSIAELRRHARGRWLLAAVAPQSLAIAAATTTHGRMPVLAVGCWVVGLIAYLGVALFILARASADRSLPAGADTWILMGALAIATVAAATISTASASGPAWCVALTRPAVPVLWALASAWIPLLLAAQWRRLPAALRHEAGRWAAVFPLGMYSIASSRLAGEFHQAPPRIVALAFFWIALAAWLVAATTPHVGHGRPRRTRG